MQKIKPQAGVRQTTPELPNESRGAEGEGMINEWLMNLDRNRNVAIGVECQIYNNRIPSYVSHRTRYVHRRQAVKTAITKSEVQVAYNHLVAKMRPSRFAKMSCLQGSDLKSKRVAVHLPSFQTRAKYGLRQWYSVDGASVGAAGMTVFVDADVVAAAGDAMCRECGRHAFGSQMGSGMVDHIGGNRNPGVYGEGWAFLQHCWQLDYPQPLLAGDEVHGSSSVSEREILLSASSISSTSAEE